MATNRDLPKLSSSCTTVVIAREAARKNDIGNPPKPSLDGAPLA